MKLKIIHIKCNLLTDNKTVDVTKYDRRNFVLSLLDWEKESSWIEKKKEEEENHTNLLPFLEEEK